MVRESIAGAVAAARNLAGQALLRPAQDAFTGALHVVALVGAVLLTAIAVVILTRLRVPPIGAAQPAPESAAAEPVAAP